MFLYNRKQILEILNNHDKHTEDEVELALAELGHVVKPKDKVLLYTFLDSQNREIVASALMTLWLGLNEIENMKDKVIQFAADLKDGSSLQTYAMGALANLAKKDTQMLETLIMIAENYKTINKDNFCWEFINNTQAWQELALLTGNPMSTFERDTLNEHPFSETSEVIRNKIREKYKKLKNEYIYQNE